MARQETAWLTLWETPHTSKNQCGLWQFVPCSRRADEDTRLPQRTAQIVLDEKNCHEEDGVCARAKLKILIYRRMAQNERRLSPSIVGRN